MKLYPSVLYRNRVAAGIYLLFLSHLFVLAVVLSLESVQRLGLLDTATQLDIVLPLLLLLVFFGILAIFAGYLRGYSKRMQQIIDLKGRALLVGSVALLLALESAIGNTMSSARDPLLFFGDMVAAFIVVFGIASLAVFSMSKGIEQNLEAAKEKEARNKAGKRAKSYAAPAHV